MPVLESLTTSSHTMSKRISFTVTGTVQGVNFRSFTAEKAKSLSITGFVKNASDGTVVGEAQGSSSNLDKFVQHLNMGPRAAKVSNLEQKDIGSKEGESEFEQYVSFFLQAIGRCQIADCGMIGNKEIQIVAVVMI
ncbi:hypothetical protein AC579_8075 [Pseudocercospora musae]|uniref:Acylphosphatase n=1 Tax=Pseudocercospora musae TaxID=113226 RepID=A0A139IFZ5_9PEZI|nr:hypothetical protein AC579_8075 [Pseudocercospora musae]